MRKPVRAYKAALKRQSTAKFMARIGANSSEPEAGWQRAQLLAKFSGPVAGYSMRTGNGRADMTRFRDLFASRKRQPCTIRKRHDRYGPGARLN